jgi:hypothetical protein
LPIRPHILHINQRVHSWITKSGGLLYEFVNRETASQMRRQRPKCGDFTSGRAYSLLSQPNTSRDGPELARSPPIGLIAMWLRWHPPARGCHPPPRASALDCTARTAMHYTLRAPILQFHDTVSLTYPPPPPPLLAPVPVIPHNDGMPWACT